MTHTPPKACDGERVLEDGDFAECAACGARIRWDLRDDPFWGFQQCREKTPAPVTGSKKAAR